MLNFFKINVFIIIFFFLIAPVFAVENNLETNINTIYLNVKRINAPKYSGKRVDKIMRKNLKKIKGLDLVPLKNLSVLISLLKEREGYKPCYKKACAIEYGDYLESGRVLIGSIKYFKKKYIQRLGRKGRDKYLLQRDSNKFYTVTMELIDVKKNKILATFKETTPTRSLNKGVYRILKKIKYFYKTGRVEKKKKVVIEKKKIPGKKREYLINLYALFTIVKPLNEYSEIAGMGYGISLGLGFTNLFFNRSAFRTYLGYDAVNSSSKMIKSYNRLDSVVAFGYNISPVSFISITPLIGGGMLYHFISGDKDGSDIVGTYEYSLYFGMDPVTDFILETKFIINRNFSVILSGRYRLLYESSNIGKVAKIELGTMITF